MKKFVGLKELQKDYNNVLKELLKDGYEVEIDNRSGVASNELTRTDLIKNNVSYALTLERVELNEERKHFYRGTYDLSLRLYKNERKHSFVTNMELLKTYQNYFRLEVLRYRNYVYSLDVEEVQKASAKSKKRMKDGQNSRLYARLLINNNKAKPLNKNQINKVWEVVKRHRLNITEKVRKKDIRYFEINIDIEYNKLNNVVYIYDDTKKAVCTLELE